MKLSKAFSIISLARGFENTGSRHNKIVYKRMTIHASNLVFNSFYRAHSAASQARSAVRYKITEEFSCEG